MRSSRRPSPASLAGESIRWKLFCPSGTAPLTGSWVWLPAPGKCRDDETRLHPVPRPGAGDGDSRGEAPGAALACPSPPLGGAHPQVQVFLYHPYITATEACPTRLGNCSHCGKPQALGCPLCSLLPYNSVSFPKASCPSSPKRIIQENIPFPFSSFPAPASVSQQWSQWHMRTCPTELLLSKANSDHVPGRVHEDNCSLSWMEHDLAGI